MFNGLSFIIENIWYIIGFIVLSIPFYILFYKYIKPNIDFDKLENINKKLLYSNKVDILEHKVFIVVALIIALIVGIGKLF